MHAGSGLYHGGQPLVMNFTVLSGLASSGWFVASPTWELLTPQRSDILQLSFTHSERISSWTGAATGVVGVVHRE